MGIKHELFAYRIFTSSLPVGRPVGLQLPYTFQLPEVESHCLVAAPAGGVSVARHATRPAIEINLSFEIT